MLTGCASGSMKMRNKRHWNNFIKVDGFIEDGKERIFIVIKFILVNGKKEWNDVTRIDDKGRGTYTKVYKGISLIKNNNKVSKKFKCIWGLCTATNENCNFVDILKYMKELEFENVQIRLIRSQEKYNVTNIINQYNHLAEFLLDEYIHRSLDYLRMILNDNDQFGKVLKRVMLNEILIRWCNAGINKVTICPDGMIYPCDSLVGISECAIGNINSFTGENYNIYEDITVNRISKCNRCDIKYLCGGDCYYNSYMKNGNQFIPDSEFCQIQRHILNLAIVLRYKMQMENKDLYSLLLREVKGKNDYSKFFG